MSTVQLPIKIDEDLKKAFINACHANDSTASQEIRKFIREYLNKNAQGQLFNK